MKFSQIGIKQENIRAVFRAILEENGISRAEIAEKTGLSLMTVGKVADAMLDAEIIVQTKPATGACGRRAGFLSMSENKFFLATNISSSIFRAAIFDIRLGRLDFITYPYNESLLFEENLTCFFGETNNMLIKHLKDKKLAGMGVAVSGNYDKEKDLVTFSRTGLADNISIKREVMKSMGIIPGIIQNSIHLSAVAGVRGEAKYPDACTATLLIDDKLYGCISVGEATLLGFENQVSDFSKLSVTVRGFSVPVDKFILESSSMKEEDLASGIAEALLPVFSIIKPCAIFVESNSRRLTDCFAEQLEASFSFEGYHPRVFVESGTVKRCEYGLAIELRDYWLDKSLSF